MVLDQKLRLFKVEVVLAAVCKVYRHRVERVLLKVKSILVAFGARAMRALILAFIITIGSFGSTDATPLTSADLFSIGDGKLTRDSISGLEWLDIPETFGLSKNDIDNGAGPEGGWSAGLGFRHASIFDVEQLYINHGFPDIDAATEANVLFFLPFFELFGGICGSPSSRCDILGITGTINEADPLPNRLFLLQSEIFQKVVPTHPHRVASR